MDWMEEARTMLPQAVALRRKIHENPELGLDNPMTRDLVIGQFEGMDVEIALGKSTSGVIVSMHGGRKGKSIILRGDTDALPILEDTCMPAATTRIPPCWSTPRSCSTATATSLLAPSNSCSSPARKASTARAT